MWSILCFVLRMGRICGLQQRLQRRVSGPARLWVQVRTVARTHDRGSRSPRRCRTPPGIPSRRSARRRRTGAAPRDARRSCPCGSRGTLPGRGDTTGSGRKAAWQARLGSWGLYHTACRSGGAGYNGNFPISVHERTDFMKMTSAVTLALTLAAGPLLADKKVDDAVAKAEEQLQKGKTDEALKTIEKLGGTQTAEAQLQVARFQERL